MKNLIKILLCAILSHLFSPDAAKDPLLRKAMVVCRLSPPSFHPMILPVPLRGKRGRFHPACPRVESHSYEPTPQDIIRIQNCDLFLYTGGESDTWVDDLLASFDEPVNTVKMMDCVEVYEEELLEGMQTEESTGTQETEYDEHVWTSPKMRS